MPSNGTTALPPPPSPLPKLPSVMDTLKSQIYTHSSNISSRDPVPYNRLALLGNAYLSAAIISILFNQTPPYEPGEMTELKNKYVSNVNVATWARAYEFDKDVRVAHRIAPSNDKLAADSFEAYLGAIVLSSSQKDLWEFIEKLVMPGLESVRQSNGLNGNTSDRNALQMLNQKLTSEGKALPEYVHEQVGDGIGGTFVVKCMLGGKEVSRGEGRSKIEGKRRAAERVLAKPAKFFTALP